MVLLEDHLAHPTKRCPDCIRKHLLTIEGYAEEALSLDRRGAYRTLAAGLAEAARHWMEALESGGGHEAVGQQVRFLRKRLVPKVCDPREEARRLASTYLAGVLECRSG